MINRVVLVGRITRDPDLKYTVNNMPFVGFTLACGRAYVDKLGNRQEITDFISCIAWNKSAEFLHRYVKTGDALGVEGRLQSRTIEQDGVKRTVMEVNCESVQLIAKKGQGQQANNDYQPNNDYRNNQGYQQNQGYQNQGYQQKQEYQNNQGYNNQKQQQESFNDLEQDFVEDDYPF